MMDELKEIKEMYEFAKRKFKETKKVEWEHYMYGIHDTLCELKIFIEGINK